MRPEIDQISTCYTGGGVGEDRYIQRGDASLRQQVFALRACMAASAHIRQRNKQHVRETYTWFSVCGTEKVA